MYQTFFFSVAEVEKPNKTSPLVKGKLKQSRLPFLPMSSQTSPKAVSPLTQKKRKLSGEGGSSPKTLRSENRQPEREARLKTEKSNDSNPKEAKSGEKKRGRPPLKEKVVKEKRKRGRPKKTSPKPNGRKNKKVDSSSLLSDDEVSSSVDDESELPRAKKKNLETTRKLLGGLYCEPTQEAKISTSTTTEDGEASEDEEISTSSTNGSLKSQVMEGEGEEQISLCSSEEEGEEEEELEISRKKETEGKDSSTGSSKEEDVEVRENKVKGSTDTQKKTGKLPAKEDSDNKKYDEKKGSSDVGDDESVSSRFEMKKKRVLPHRKKGEKMAEQGKNAHNAKTPEDRSEKTRENQKKTDTKAETKRGKKKRTRLGNEESVGVKKYKLANGKPGKEGGKGKKVENKDSEERKSNDSDNSVKNNRNDNEEEGAEDCKEEKESDQNVDTDVKQKEKEATEQDEIVENLDGAIGSEKRDSEDDEADSEKNKDKSEAIEDGSLNEETGESKTNEHTSESSTSTPGKESKIKDASENDRKTENSKKRKRRRPNSNEIGKGKQVGRKEMDRDSLGGKEKTATPKQDGVVSIAKFFSPIPKSEETRRKSLGSEKKNQEQDNKRKEVGDNTETKHDKERKEEKNNDGEQADEKEVKESGDENKEQQENREEVDCKGSQKHMEGKEIITNEASNQKEEDKQLMDKSNTEEDEQQMNESMNMGSGDTSLSPSTSKSPTSSTLNSKALTPKTASGLPEKKLTPKQKMRVEEFQRKRLEREKKKQEEQAERERKRKEEQAEKERKRKEEQAEKERKRKEEQAEKEKKKKEKEEERIKLKEEKEKLKEDQKKKKQEELDAKRQTKEEEKQRKEEVKKQAEKEKSKQTEKLKNKFASFFVAKRREVEGEEDEDSGLFMQFRIKEDMRLAPLHRSQLTSDQIANLDSCLSTPGVKPSTKNYLKALGTKEYVKGSAPRSWPRKKTKDVDNDVEIIEEDDEEDPEEAALDTAVMQDLGNEPLPTGSQSRAKLLLFFENRRPAYWGTWSKMSVAVSGRRPFARDGVFDYEYDSDDDWEEEETGESLSDSEGEEKEEDEDQYEVDNDFFVPHGYLSDDEAKSDQEEVVEQEMDEVPQVDGGRNLKLKQKQAEFDKEMKRKTKELKPRLIGCLWLADKNNNPAYHQLLKVLDPYKAVALCPLPIDTLVMGPEGEERVQEEDGGVPTEDKKPKFYRMFPEGAVPSLIRLVHGNRNGKSFLTSEFRDYQRKDCIKEEVPLIARKKIERKVKELGRWCKCPDEGPMHSVMMWYVPKEIREKYGLEDLTLPNTWTYINTPKTQDDPQQAASTEDAGTNKTPKHQTITAFTRKIVPGSAHPPSLLTTPVRDNKQNPKTPKNVPITTFAKRITPGLALPSTTTTTSTPTPSPSTTAPTPSSTPTSTSTPKSHTKADGSPGNNQALESSPNVSRELRTGNKPGRKRSLTKSQGVIPPKTSIVSFFKKNSSKRDSLSKTKSPSNVGSSSQEEMDCIVID
ncbi:hypothetical protein Pmani_005385 [Petrolisthes manimaculis]|uniref:Chromatin assembly factor 1 subunit A n=1 Tax=Petrolisthes manimaculis TaxID=1843537 RepID=A0AAE1QCA1_9EUCA|nr:hypothetical protein Pmani_005385 [Petrolisthes manimaculis]